eukprot:1136264-Pelagomonas_calceolata.AAC.1
MVNAKQIQANSVVVSQLLLGISFIKVTVDTQRIQAKSEREPAWYQGLASGLASRVRVMQALTQYQSDASTDTV